MSTRGATAVNVPWTTPLAWMPLVIGAWMLFSRFDGCKRWVLSLVALVGADVVLDPGAAALGLWVWENPGFWYGIPLTNYIGWIVSGAIGLGICWWLLKDVKHRAVWSYTAIVAYWTGVCFALELWGAGIVGVVLLGISSVIQLRIQEHRQ